jgi:hypothetical protein
LGIVQGDLLIKRAVELMLDEVRKNDWLIDDILSDLVNDPLLADIYGEKEIRNCKEWFRNNKVHVQMRFRKDSQEFPCVTIALGDSSEVNEEATLADQTTETDQLEPSEISRPIPYVIKPYPVSYADGVLAFPANYPEQLVAPGMVAVDPATGNAYEITEITSTGFRLKDSPALTGTQYGILPEHRYWLARREAAKFAEQFNIGCHVQGDPAPLLWLHSIVVYGLLRYRESLLEARGYQLSSIRSTDFMRNDAFQLDASDAYSRWIIMTGKLTNSWLKSPQRVIETTSVKDINILSSENSDPQVAPTTQDTWHTVKETAPVTRKYTKKNPV